ncbi:hypothetical protein SAMN05216406_11315 [Nitrosomonas ureae]|uniref:Lipoprotein n=1 Tax=Nitrosomonas ureae TaxID=44577 RepID=A0A1H2EIU6_9PROT|nr:hypothetical protein ATY38_03155 [Nitrosomonas ureae]SDT95010.1 hypothetical protein SAMN05216406_11315 [Nitrosomonas ureae]
MRIPHFFAVSVILVLVACGGRPIAPETRDPEAYGKTISLSIKFRQVISKGAAKPGPLKKNRIIKFFDHNRSVL